jgi:PAS domain S-box-containing protein
MRKRNGLRSSADHGAGSPAASVVASMPEPLDRDTRVGHSQLLALIDNTSAVIYMRDLTGHYMLVNREYERLFNLRREEVIGLTDHALFPAEIADEFRANDLRAAASGGPTQFEEVAPAPDGNHTYVTVKFPLLDAAGEPYAVCGISTDITDRKRAEDQVSLLNSELEQRVEERTAELEASTRELDAFAYSVSHDLRAPLRSLDGFSQVLLEDYSERLDDEGREYLRRLQSNVARMAQMIDDLLDLSRATRIELQRETVDLTGLGREIFAELREEEPGRLVDTVVAEGLVAAGDPHLLRLVLYNLAANAWKFTGSTASPRIEFGQIDHDGQPAFFVADNGAGFNMRYAGKLFEPFQRLHTTADFDGSGIGLAIVYRIIRRHGGQIWADAETDRGATFFFTLSPSRSEIGS